jgi:hypothetical protein
MESRNNNTQVIKKKFQLYQHPWLSLLVVMVTSVFSIALAGTVHEQLNERILTCNKISSPPL